MNTAIWIIAICEIIKVILIAIPVIDKISTDMAVGDLLEELFRR